MLNLEKEGNSDRLQHGETEDSTRRELSRAQTQGFCVALRGQRHGTEAGWGCEGWGRGCGWLVRGQSVSGGEDKEVGQTMVVMVHDNMNVPGCTLYDLRYTLDNGQRWKILLFVFYHS